MSDTVNNETIDLGGAPGEDFDPFADDADLDVDIASDATAETLIQPPAVPEANENTDTKVLETSDNNVAAELAEPVESDNPLTVAMDVAEAKDVDNARQSLYGKPPVFEYAGATENIEDSSLTFDELRIAKATDFPELEDGKRVNWTVEYGKITKAVSDAKGMSIAKMKSDIETSKEFIDALKKAKDKSPDCKVKPKVTAAPKGLTSSYRGEYINIDEATASGKLITLFPAKDGNVYEMRNTEMGKFITRAANNDLLREVKAGFIPALPPIPLNDLLDIIGFFKLMAQKGREALAYIYWDKQDSVFKVDIPEQTASIFHVKGDINPEYDNERYIHYMDIHSHHCMDAFFSSTDDASERATRVYAVVGNVLSYFPEIKVRISNGGKFHEISPDTVFEDFNKISKLPKMWFRQLRHNLHVFSGILQIALGCNVKGEADKSIGDVS